MEIKNEKINFVLNDKLTICQKEIKDELELGRRFIEYALTPLENKFGLPTEIKIRKDIEDNISGSHIEELGGNNNKPVFMRNINVITINEKSEKLIITIFLSVQKPKPHKDKINFFRKILERIGII